VKVKASLSSAEDQMNDTRIGAPVSGIVLSKNVELGQLISSATSNVGGGTLLATVADMNDVYVYAKVDEVDIGKIKVGQKASVVADAYPEDSFDGQVERIAPQGLTQQNVTTFDVIIRMRNEGLKLKAGMSTSVDIQVFNRINILLLPNEALKDPKSEQGKALMTEANLTLPKEVSVTQVKPGNSSKEESDRKKRRELLDKMSPEEREKARSEWRQKMQQSGEQGGGNAGNGGGAQVAKPRRAAQVNNENEVRWRVVIVKGGDGYKPRLVKTGASNFDNTEVLDGLKEGDEIQITSISRAKIASERMTERIKSSTPLGGMGTGGGGGGR
jgi:HlyD family secretion protein